MLNTLGDWLNPYSEIISKVAGTITCLQFLSGIVFLNDIRKRGIADEFPVAPFLGGIVLSILSLKHGAIIDDSAMIYVNLCGLAINIVFILVFYVYTSSENRPNLWRKFILSGLFIFACLTYANYEDPKLIEFRFGMLITSILIMLIGSPFLELGDIIRKKSTENLPRPMIIAGTIVSSSWLLYAISIKNSVLIYQNGFLLLLSSIQLTLIIIYPRKPKED